MSAVSDNLIVEHRHESSGVPASAEAARSAHDVESTAQCAVSLLVKR